MLQLLARSRIQSDRAPSQNHWGRFHQCNTCRDYTIKEHCRPVPLSEVFCSIMKQCIATMINIRPTTCSTSRLMFVALVTLFTFSDGRRGSQIRSRPASLKRESPYNQVHEVEQKGFQRKLESGGDGKGGGKGGGKGEGKGGSKGGSHGSGSSSGSGMSQAWVDGEYFGCLALSQDELTQMRSSGQYIDCDYTIHIAANDTSTTNSSTTGSGTNASSTQGAGSGATNTQKR